MFLQPARRVTKLTDKAKAAIEEKIDLSKKRKNAASGANVAPVQSKKAKPTQDNGPAKDTARSESRSEFEDTCPPAGVVDTTGSKEDSEEADSYANADLIDDDSGGEGSAPRASSVAAVNVETAEDELSKTNNFNLYISLIKS